MTGGGRDNTSTPHSLKKPEVDVRRVLRTRPSILASDIGVLKKRDEWMQDRGLDVARVVSTYPGALNHRTNTLEAKLKLLAAHGNTIETINLRPATLRIGIDTLVKFAAAEQELAEKPDLSLTSPTTYPSTCPPAIVYTGHSLFRDCIRWY